MSRLRLLRTEAIVIKRIDFGEADRILTLFSPFNGKLRAVAKGSRRVTSKLGGHVDLCTHVNLLLARGRDLDIVTQAETLHAFIDLREDLRRAGSACYVADLTDRLTAERVENRAVFALLLETLLRLATGPQPAVALRTFELQLLGHLGYRPELQRCIQCAGALVPGPNFFSAAAGGTLCDRCGRGLPAAREMSVNAIKVLRLMQSGDYSTAARLRIDRRLQQELEDILASHIGYILESELRSAGVLRTMVTG